MSTLAGPGRRFEEIEAAAWRQQYAGLEDDLRGLAVDVAGLSVFGVGAWAESPWHHVITGVTSAEAGKGLDVALSLLTRLGALSPMVQVVDDDTEAVGPLLLARGFGRTTRLVRMSAPAVDLPLPDGVAEATDGASVASVCLKGFGQNGVWRIDQRWWRGGLGREGWTQVLARSGDLAVGTGALFVAGDQAWVGSGTTVPDARGRGVHAALLSARLGLAARAGAATVSVKCAPGSAAYRSLVRAGFTAAYGVSHWRRPQSVSAAGGAA